MAIEIVELIYPLKMVIFHSFFYVYQRVHNINIIRVCPNIEYLPQFHWFIIMIPI